MFGAGGGLGIHMLMMAHWAGTRVIAIDLAASKFDACREAGADEIVDATAENVTDALLELTGGDGVDVAIDFVSSSSTLEAASKNSGSTWQAHYVGREWGAVSGQIHIPC